MKVTTGWMRREDHKTHGWLTTFTGFLQRYRHAYPTMHKGQIVWVCDAVELCWIAWVRFEFSGPEDSDQELIELVARTRIGLVEFWFEDGSGI